MRLRFPGIAAFLLLWAASPDALAGTISGLVQNGTTGKAVPGIEVILIQLQGGMEPVAQAKTDAQGHYSLTHPQAGQAPMLVRVQYRGVNYHANVPPGKTQADVTVYEATATPQDIAVRQRVILFQPEGATLVVGEEYSVRNRSNPPATFYLEQGSFEFSIPEGASLSQVSAAGPAGMPLVQGTMSKGGNRYAIPFPLKPGENTIRLSYQLPYSSNQAAIRLASPYATEKVLLWAPATMQVQAAGFSQAGSEQGGNISVRETVSAGAVLNISISGTAPAQSAEAQSAAGQGGGQAEGAAVHPAPGRIDSLKWILIAGFSALFGIGLIFLWRQPRSEPPSAPRPAGVHAAALAEVDRTVQGGLDEIRDTLLRIELRRQAGTISDVDYAAQRSQAEKMLAKLIKG